jgi:hypothetical protein
VGGLELKNEKRCPNYQKRQSEKCAVPSEKQILKQVSISTEVGSGFILDSLSCLESQLAFAVYKHERDGQDYSGDKIEQRSYNEIE